MANKKRTLKRRKMSGGWSLFGNDNKSVDNTVVDNKSNVSNEDPTKDSIKDPKEAAVRSPETVSQTPEPDIPWYRRWFGIGGKRKTNKRKSKRNTSQQKR
jgi:hypothetical protein